MGIIRFAINNPVKIAVGVILIVLFGFVAILRVPMQLTPDVDRPVISVKTTWVGASPQEIESEIVDRQEDKLKNVTGLKKMTSTASQGQATITLEFPVGIDWSIAYRNVSDKLRQVTGYPEEIDEPTITATDSGMDKTIAWMMMYAKDGEDVAPLKTFIIEKVKPILERAEGIAEVDVYGGRDREIQIEIDAEGLAARALTFRDVERALRQQNVNVSAGTITQGKRDYTYRTVGEFRTLEDIEQTVVAYRDGGPVYIRDIARVIDGFKKPVSFVRSKGRFVLALPARRETGANVLSAMESLKKQIAKVNAEVLEPRGLGLELTQVYDETKYIISARNLVVTNIFFGGLLAIIVLVVFLRSASATGIVTVAIPISVIGTFLVIRLLNRSLNVVMLAGMAFAVGMVVDNAIVVLENIYRHRSMGKSRPQAALDGAREVWGAVLASTLTTMAVFIPVITIEEEAGQLFKDIAIAISSAVAMSLLVSVLVIPPLAARFLSTSRASRRADEDGEAGGWRLGMWIASLVETLLRGVGRRIAVVVGLSLFAVLGSILLMPSTEYLPAGNKNLVFGFLFSPPGYSIEEFRRMSEIVQEGDPDDPFDGLRPRWEAETMADVEHLAKVDIPLGRSGETVRTVTAPPIDNFFYVSFDGGAFMGCTAKDPTNVKPLVYVMKEAGGRVPGVFAVFHQSSLFASGLRGGGSVDLEIRGDDRAEVVAAAKAARRRIMELGYDRPTGTPANFDLGRPEIQLVPDRTKSADLGLDVRDVGFIVRACIDGAFVGEFNDRGDKVDMALKVAGTAGASMDQIGQIPIYTASGHIVPLATTIDFRRTTAPQQITHIEEMNSVTLSVTPPLGVPLQETMRRLEEEVVAPLRAQGIISKGIITGMAGTADKLTQTQRALVGDFRGLATRPKIPGLSVGASLVVIALALAVAVIAVRFIRGGRWATRVALGGIVVGGVAFFVANPGFAEMALQSRAVLALLITYLLMAALFESFAYPFVIMFSVPLAAVGGFAALRIVHEVSWYDISSPIQQLDVLTMLGFVILVGIVVNNAILIVHQALNNMRDGGMDPKAATIRSVQTRTRPIFMSALTSIFGMLPLVIMTGPGSELYRGLGSVVLGGLLVSTLFSLLVVPVMFTLFLDFRSWLAARSG